MTVSYPDRVWDGSSPTRDAALGTRRQADKSDFDQLVSEISAMQIYLGAQGAVAGSVPDATQLTIIKNSIAKYQTTLVSFDNVIVPLADGPPGPAYGSKKIWDFPAGVIYATTAAYQVTITKSSIGVDDDWKGDIGMGSAPANGVDGLTAIEHDWYPTEPTPQAVDGATSLTLGKVNHNIIDAQITPTRIYMNLLVDLTDHDIISNPCNLIVNGFFFIAWLHFTS